MASDRDGVEGYVAADSRAAGAPRWKVFLVDIMRQGNLWATRRLAPGMRTVAGLLCILGGIFGFLPILGFWMIPLGFILIAMEVPAFRKPMRVWITRHKNALRRSGASGE